MSGLIAAAIVATALLLLSLRAMWAAPPLRRPLACVAAAMGVASLGLVTLIRSAEQPPEPGMPVRAIHAVLWGLFTLSLLVQTIGLAWRADTRGTASALLFAAVAGCVGALGGAGVGHAVEATALCAGLGCMTGVAIGAHAHALQRRTGHARSLRSKVDGR